MSTSPSKKVQRKKLSDGTILARQPSISGSGYDYFQDMGPKLGLAYIGTTTSPRARKMLLEILIWDLDVDYKEPAELDLIPLFNDKGWVM